MATVNKNFRVKNGLVVEGSTATVGGNNVLVENGGDQYILDLIGGETLVKTVDTATFTVDGSGNLTINSGVFDASGAADTAEDNANSYTDTALQSYTATSSLDNTVGGYGYLKTADLPTMYSDSDVDAHLSGGDGISYVSGALSVDLDGAGGLGFNQGTLGINRNTVDSWYDAAGSASSAQTAAQNYADGLASNYDAAGSASSAQTAAQNYADGLASNYDAAGAASTAESNANSYTNTALEDYTPTSSLDATVDGYGYLKSADLSGYATESYVDTAVSDLVGTAPSTLDTLQELATALENNPDIIADLQSVASGKQNTLTAGSNIDITADTISVTGLDSADISDFNTAALSATSSAYDAAGAAATAQSNAEDYADNLASNYDAAGSASSAQTAAEGHADDLAADILDGTSAFTAVNINDVAKEVAAEATIATVGSANAITWLASEYGTAKALVKFKTATHSQVSEILLTLDGSGNIAITDYAETGTNGSLGTITAVNTAGTVAISVTTVYANTDVSVKATLIK